MTKLSMVANVDEMDHLLNLSVALAAFRAAQQRLN